MERDFACELFRALEANPHFPIAAPQIYEALAAEALTLISKCCEESKSCVFSTCVCQP